jgi:hypothetical protein
MIFKNFFYFRITGIMAVVASMWYVLSFAYPVVLSYDDESGSSLRLPPSEAVAP